MPDESGNIVIAALEQLRRDSSWVIAEQHPLQFPVFHAQGVTRTGENRLLVSSVEIIHPPIRYAEISPDGYDRSPGAGQAHLFEVDGTGRLLRQATLGEGTVYHPGGIDYDGAGTVWVTVSEYRPDSRAIAYRVDAETLDAQMAFIYQDHLGGVVCDRATGLLHAVTWGSRRLLTMSRDGEVLHETTNKNHVVDFQSCIAVEGDAMVCTGVTEYDAAAGSLFQLGSAAVVDASTGYIRLEVPIMARAPSGRVVTYNAVHMESDGDRLSMFVVDDGTGNDDAVLLRLETQLDREKVAARVDQLSTKLCL